MKFLKALRKLDVQTPELKSAEGELIPQAEGKFGHLIPGIVNDPSIKIGLDAQGSGLKEDSGKSSVSFGVRQTPLDQGRGKKLTTTSVDEARVNEHIVAITNPKSPFCEEYRNLRATLLQKRKKHKLRTIAVLSVAPSEGKSITALNLAWLFAQTDGLTVLVIDGDLRVPSLKRYLGVESESGLSDVLAGDVQLEDAIIRLEPSGLHLLPGGDVRPDAAEQFSGPMFTRLLDKVQETFDFVIIDAPPLSVFAEAKVLMDQTDGSILVVRSNYTKFKDVGRILEGVSRNRILGVVLNRSEELLIGGKYYDYQYYQDSKK
jgi:protein-tyrosine kinase